MRRGKQEEGGDRKGVEWGKGGFKNKKKEKLVEERMGAKEHGGGWSEKEEKERQLKRKVRNRKEEILTCTPSLHS